MARALASRKPVLLFFKARGCSLCGALQDSVADLEASQGVRVCAITTDDQAAWAPEVRRQRQRPIGAREADASSAVRACTLRAPHP